MKNYSAQNNYYYLCLYDLLIIYNTESLELTSRHLLYFENIGSYSHTILSIILAKTYGCKSLFSTMNANK